MSAIQTVFVALLMVSAGCSFQRHSEMPTATEEHAILKALAMRDRNAVHVALWTLGANGLPYSQEISFDLPYSKVRPQIQAVREQLQTFPQERLDALDQSLAYHWQIYSPIWSSHDWP